MNGNHSVSSGVQPGPDTSCIIDVDLDLHRDLVGIFHCVFFFLKSSKKCMSR